MISDTHKEQVEQVNERHKISRRKTFRRTLAGIVLGTALVVSGIVIHNRNNPYEGLDAVPQYEDLVEARSKGELQLEERIRTLESENTEVIKYLRWDKDNAMLSGQLALGGIVTLFLSMGGLAVGTIITRGEKYEELNSIGKKEEVYRWASPRLLTSLKNVKLTNLSEKRISEYKEKYREVFGDYSPNIDTGKEETE